MIVLDSSGWLEYFADGPFAATVADHLRKPEEVVTSVIALYEVYKWLKREHSEPVALHAVAAMKSTQVVELTDSLALLAGDLALEFGLAMADAMMLATARLHGARLITTDSDFTGIPDVDVLSKKGG